MFIGRIPEAGKQALAGVGVRGAACTAAIWGGGEYSPGEENLSPWRKIILLIPMIFLLPHL